MMTRRSLGFTLSLLSLLSGSRWSALLVASAKVTLPRFLGSIATKINGKWQEFDSNGTVGSEAYPCNTDCSNSSNSEALGTNAAPWTFDAPNSCTTLQVVEGYSTGQAIYTVFDNNVALGNTTLGTNGTTCGSDPDACFADSKAGKGSFALAKGSHSLRLVVAIQDSEVDGGWFRLVNATCPTTRSPTKAPTKSPNRAPTKAPTKKPTRAPSSGNSTKAPTRKPGRCISPLRCANRILDRDWCRCRPLINRGRTTCAKKRAKARCCPRAKDRDKKYVSLVVRKLKRLCRQ